MATFSENQVRHLYVANESKTASALSTGKLGAIAVCNDKTKSHMYFQYKGAGGLTRSDLIDVKNIISVKATDADSLSRTLAKHKLILDKNVNSGNPVAGQDYILRIEFRNYIGISDEDQYNKFGSVHAVTGMTPSNFYKELVLSLVQNFSKEEEGLLKFYLEKGGTSVGTVAGTPVEVTRYTKPSTLSETYTGIVIEELPQEWILGVMSQRPLVFDIIPGTIIADGDERTWGETAKVKSTAKVENGKTIADLEYFCMGERGDQNRMMGFPNVVRTTYLVNPDLKYNVIDIHYSYTGSNENVQKSEKTITLVVPKIGSANSESNKLANEIIDAINTATGLTVDKLKVD